MQVYQDMVEQGSIREDNAQRRMVEKLYKLQQGLQLQGLSESSGFFQKLFSSPDNQSLKGLYIYGDVGRGKSMLMDLFFETVAVKNKRRVHFHAFMLEIHRVMYLWRRENKNNPDASDPVPPLASRIAAQAQLLCFDEFQVSDIADAMILGRLFAELFKRKVVVVATSNTAPEELYKDGLQRENFLPFIDLLQKHVEVAKLSAYEDYRLSRLKALSTVYFVPAGEKGDAFLQTIFAQLTNNAFPEPCVLEVSGRKLHLNKTHGDVVWVDFAQMCEEALGAADYIELAREFSTVLLSGVPRFTRENRNECKRFVTLIDELYEHHVKLICTAAATPQYLYVEGNDHFEFQRTVSRLMEMQSESYMRESHVA